jgi:hypothetical protein
MVQAYNWGEFAGKLSRRRGGPDPNGPNNSVLWRATRGPEPDGRIGTHTKLRITAALAFSLYVVNRH